MGGGVRRGLAAAVVIAALAAAPAAHAQVTIVLDPGHNRYPNLSYEPIGPARRTRPRQPGGPQGRPASDGWRATRSDTRIAGRLRDAPDGSGWPGSLPTRAGGRSMPVPTQTDPARSSARGGPSRHAVAGLLCRCDLRLDLDDQEHAPSGARPASNPLAELQYVTSVSTSQPCRRSRPAIVPRRSAALVEQAIELTAAPSDERDYVRVNGRESVAGSGASGAAPAALNLRNRCWPTRAGRDIDLAGPPHGYPKAGRQSFTARREVRR